MNDASGPIDASSSGPGASPDPEDSTSEDRDAGLWTAPNLITLLRLACIPVFVWFLFSRENRAAAAWIMGALGATDWVDGYLARRFNQVSNIGKILDPVADRLLLIVGAVSIMIDGSIPLWFAIAALARELLVGAAGLALGAMGARRIDVRWVGKAGTFALMFAFPLFLGGHSTLSYDALLTVLAWIFAIPGLILSYYSAAGYVSIGAEALREGRSARAEAARE